MDEKPSGSGESHATPEGHRQKTRSSSSFSNNLNSETTPPNTSAPNEYEKLEGISLTTAELDILKDQIALPEIKLNYFSLFRYANSLDLFLLAIACLASIISGAALPLFTLIFGSLTQVFTNFFVNGSDPHEFQHTVNHNTLYFVYLGVGITITSFLQTYLHVDRGEVITARIRRKYLQAILRQNVAYFDHVGAGEVTTRITSDISQIQDGISEKIGLILSGVATFFAAFVIGFIKSWRMTLILSSVVVAISLNMGIASKYIIKFTMQNLTEYGKAASIAEDVLSSIRTTVAFGSQDRLANKFDEMLHLAFIAGVKRGKAIAIMVALLWTIIYLCYGLAFWQGSRFIVDGVLEVGSLVTVAMAIIIGALALGGITPCFQAIGSAMGAAHKVYEAIDRVPAIDAAAESQGEKLSRLEGHIRFEHVKFAYPSRPNVTVLEDFSLSIEPGQTVALVGSSGSGKSTIVGLLERFYSHIGGEITIDGHPIESLNVKWLRQQLALVSQEPTLFSCSIYENVAFGLIGTPYEHAEESQKKELIINACREANAWEFIQTLSYGLDTEVGERGFLLSGGQKQRIAIARAIVSQPKILLLDEATSALDTKSEGVVQEALDRAVKSRTTIVIAHRLSTIRDASKIVVMSHGQIVEVGTHNELLDKKGAYYLLVKAQNIRAMQEQNAATKEETTLDLDLTEKSSDEELVPKSTGDSELSVSAKVVKDLEAKGFYDREVRTRSMWQLIKFVSRAYSFSDNFLTL